MFNRIEDLPSENKSLTEIEEESLEKVDLKSLSAQQQYEVIMDKASAGLDSYVGEELLAKLEDSKETGKPLEVKFGIDPTGSDIHIGHGVPLIMLRRFQNMGHNVHLLIGDFTAKVGDPSGSNKEREVISNEQIRKNMRTYIEQVSKVLNIEQENIDIRYNSEWLEKISFDEWLEISRKISANKLVQRDYFKKRVEKGESVSLLELSYPILMAYDSVVMEPDIEIGGEDQLVNLLWCRELMHLSGKRPESFVTVEILSGTNAELDEDGKLKKMSKSANNYIKINENPEEMFAKVMSIPDDLMWSWFKNLTDISNKNLELVRKGFQTGEFQAKEVKKLLSRLVVSMFNSGDNEVVKEAENMFDQKFGKNKVLVPDDIEKHQVLLGRNLIDTLSELTGESKSSLRKSVAGIYMLKENKYERLTLEDLLTKKIEEETLNIKIGKRRYYELQGVEKISEKAEIPEAEKEQSTYETIVRIINEEPLIEKEPSLNMIGKSLDIKGPKSIYYGTGIATPEYLSIGLPFDVLGMILLNEKIRRIGSFSKVFHHIADTHAKTNSWSISEDVDKRAMSVRTTLEEVFKNLGLNNFEVVLSSEFDKEEEYLELLKKFEKSDKHNYVKHEMADMEWYRRKNNVVLKTGWIIQAKETSIGSDERLFDREYREFKGNESMSFIYSEAGRTFDINRPKASPYIQIPGETRLLLDRNENVKKKFAEVISGIGEDKMKGTIKHIEKIVKLYEELYGSLGELSIEEKIQGILDICFAKPSQGTQVVNEG